MSAADEQLAEAHDILSTCTTDTRRPLVAWAAGVSIRQHALYLSVLPLPRRTLAPEMYGASSRGCWWEADRHSFRIGRTDGHDRTVLLTLAWPEIEDLMVLDKVGLPLYREIGAVLEQRRAVSLVWYRTGLPGRESEWQQSPEGRRNRETWWEIEAECHRLGALAWDRCRPAVEDVQLDLFDLVAS